jgi:hypothetical protein
MPWASAFFARADWRTFSAPAAFLAAGFLQIGLVEDDAAFLKFLFQHPHRHGEILGELVPEALIADVAVGAVGIGVFQLHRAHGAARRERAALAPAIAIIENAGNVLAAADHSLEFLLVHDLRLAA